MEIYELSATEMLAGLTRGDLSSAEIVAALTKRADAVEPHVGAFAQRWHEAALAQARVADDERARGELRGPLHGLPMTIKENVDVEGMVSSIGLRAQTLHRAANDAVVVHLARQAGAILLGKSNVPQALASPMECANHVYGTTRNPWCLDHGPGGSSGGEGALLASGSSVLGIGTDLGGSIRFPASYCGVVGFKPTTDRWSNRGTTPALPGQELIRAQIGPMARRVADVTLLLRSLDSPQHTPLDVAVSPLPIGDPTSIDVRTLRIGVYDDDGFIRPAAPVQRAVREAAAHLRAMGATVVEMAPADQEEVIRLYVAALAGDGMSTLRGTFAGEDPVESMRLLWRLGRAPSWTRRLAARVLRQLGEPRLASMTEVSGPKSVEQWWRMTTQRNVLRARELSTWQRAGIDALLCPATVTAAVPIGMSHDFTLAFGYCGRYNLFGFPAGVIPFTTVRHDETRTRSIADRVDRRAAAIEARGAGLPVAVQIVAKPFHDEVALAILGTLEATASSQPEPPRTPVEPTRAVSPPPNDKASSRHT